MKTIYCPHLDLFFVLKYLYPQSRPALFREMLDSLNECAMIPCKNRISVSCNRPVLAWEGRRSGQLELAPPMHLAAQRMPSWKVVGRMTCDSVSVFWLLSISLRALKSCVASL